MDAMALHAEHRIHVRHVKTLVTHMDSRRLGFPPTLATAVRALTLQQLGCCVAISWGLRRSHQLVTTALQPSHVQNCTVCTVLALCMQSIKPPFKPLQDTVMQLRPYEPTHNAQLVCAAWHKAGAARPLQGYRRALSPFGTCRSPPPPPMLLLAATRCSEALFGRARGALGQLGEWSKSYSNAWSDPTLIARIKLLWGMCVKSLGVSCFLYSHSRRSKHRRN
jgi:hypothetical protein